MMQISLTTVPLTAVTDNTVDSTFIAVLFSSFFQKSTCLSIFLSTWRYDGQRLKKNLKCAISGNFKFKRYLTEELIRKWKREHVLTVQLHLVDAFVIYCIISEARNPPLHLVLEQIQVTTWKAGMTKLQIAGEFHPEPS